MTRYSNRELSDRAVIGQVFDRQRRRLEAERQASQPESPPCRFKVHPDHSCVRNTGEPIRPGEVCWYEANALAVILCDGCGRVLVAQSWTPVRGRRLCEPCYLVAVPEMALDDRDAIEKVEERAREARENGPEYRWR